MNRNQFNPDNQNPEQPYYSQEIDKTFVEGNINQQPFSSMAPGTRVNATSFSGNPFAQQANTQTRVRNRYTSPADALPSGSQPIPLGSGTVVGLLGCGGMAKVYKIWNEKLEVFRAVKILLPTQQADLKSRFETEAKITAKLQHPNIVEIYNVGEWNGLPFLEMEYIDGVSLEALITANGKLPNAVCSSIAILVARALEYAHCREFLLYGKNYHGVIHRDLKPANIMIPKIGDVRLMDFGIARPTEASLHTVEGNIVGTMQYLSPEQMDGIDIDARSDIYSFGAILYEILTGTKTFPQDTITNLMKKKVMNEYRKFSDFDFQVSAHLARISQKCLQINKADRFSSSTALLAELESAHKSLTSEPPQKVIKRYLNNPAAFINTEKTGFQFRISSKAVLPAVGVFGIAALVAVYIYTGPKSDEPDIVAPPAADTLINKAQPDTAKKYVAEDEPSERKIKPDLLPKHNNEKPEKRPPAKKRDTPSAITPKPLPEVETAKPDINQTALSPLDKLKKKYDENDLLLVGKIALRARNIDDAVFALENVPASHPDAALKTLLLFEAYLANRQLGDALTIANTATFIDAQFDFLCGKLYEQTNNPKKAIESYQAALTKPSVFRNRNEVCNDALYQTAEIWTNQHRSNPTADTRIQVLNAWNTVKKNYDRTPEHPRFKRANSELASIQ